MRIKRIFGIIKFQLYNEYIVCVLRSHTSLMGYNRQLHQVLLRSIHNTVGIYLQLLDTL